MAVRHVRSWIWVRAVSCAGFLLTVGKKEESKTGVCSIPHSSTGKMRPESAYRHPAANRRQEVQHSVAVISLR